MQLLPISPQPCFSQRSRCRRGSPSPPDQDQWKNRRPPRPPNLWSSPNPRPPNPSDSLSHPNPNRNPRRRKVSEHAVMYSQNSQHAMRCHCLGRGRIVHCLWCPSAFSFYFFSIFFWSSVTDFLELLYLFIFLYCVITEYVSPWFHVVVVGRKTRSYMLVLLLFVCFKKYSCLF